MTEGHERGRRGALVRVSRNFLYRVWEYDARRRRGPVRDTAIHEAGTTLRGGALMQIGPDVRFISGPGKFQAPYFMSHVNTRCATAHRSRPVRRSGRTRGNSYSCCELDPEN